MVRQNFVPKTRPTAAVHLCAAAKLRAIAPVTEVSAFGTFAAEPQPRSCATAPAAVPSPAYPTATLTHASTPTNSNPLILPHAHAGSVLDSV